MKIRKIALCNFLTFGETEQSIDFDDLTTIVGPNDSGKTNIFRAITTAAAVLDRKITDARSLHHFGDIGKEFRIEIDVEFSPDEEEALYNFLFCGSLQQDMHREGRENQELAYALNAKIMQRYATKFFAGFFNKASIIVIGKGLENYVIEPILKITKGSQSLYLHDYATITLSEKPIPQHHSTGVGNLIYDKIKKQNPEKFSQYLKEEVFAEPDLKTKMPDLFDYSYDLLSNEKNLSSIHIHQVYFDQFEKNPLGYPNEAKRLRAFLLDRGNNENGHTLLKFVSTIFENSIIRTSNIRSFPEESILENNEKLPPFNFHNVNGKNLPLMLFNLKNNLSEKNRDSFKIITEEFSKIFNDLKFDVVLDEKLSSTQHKEISTIPSNHLARETSFGFDVLGIKNTSITNILRKLEIQITKNKISIPLESTAAGVFETIFILTCILGHKNKTILLDEPALNLHPHMQKRILELIKRTIRENKNRVILITHSPYLINIDNFTSIWRLNTFENSTRVNNLKKVFGIDKKEEQRITMQLQNSEIRSMLFSRGLILTEGPSDKIVIEKLDKYLSEKKKGPKLDENEWSIIDINGKDNLHLFLNLARLLKIPHVTIMDYDALMYCNKKIKIGSIEAKTSVIPHHLNEAGLLTKLERQKIHQLKEHIKNISVKKLHGVKGVEHVQQWYEQKYLEDLNRIARKYNFFVFIKDLENALQKPTTKKESKPLKAFEVVQKQILSDKISDELSLMMKFVNRVVLRTNQSRR